MKGIKFDNFHSFTEWGLILSEKDIKSPKPKTKEVDIDRRHGQCDHHNLACWLQTSGAAKLSVSGQWHSCLVMHCNGRRSDPLCTIQNRRCMGECGSQHMAANRYIIYFGLITKGTQQ